MPTNRVAAQRYSVHVVRPSSLLLRSPETFALLDELIRSSNGELQNSANPSKRGCTSTGIAALATTAAVPGLPTPWGQQASLCQQQQQLRTQGSMVRFHWHVEDGSGASIPAGAMNFHKDTAVQHINCNIEIPGEPHAQAIITVPRGYLSEGKVKEAGILLGHDMPESWDGALLTGIAVALAEAGVLPCWGACWSDAACRTAAAAAFLCLRHVLPAAGKPVAVVVL